MLVVTTPFMGFRLVESEISGTPLFCIKGTQDCNSAEDQLYWFENNNLNIGLIIHPIASPSITF